MLKERDHNPNDSKSIFATEPGDALGRQLTYHPVRYDIRVALSSEQLIRDSQSFGAKRLEVWVRRQRTPEVEDDTVDALQVHEPSTCVSNSFAAFSGTSRTKDAFASMYAFRSFGYFFERTCLRSAYSFAASGWAIK